MLKCFKNEKLWCVVGGAVAMVDRQEDRHCKEDPSAGCFRSGKGHEAAE